MISGLFFKRQEQLKQLIMMTPTPAQPVLNLLIGMVERSAEIVPSCEYLFGGGFNFDQAKKRPSRLWVHICKIGDVISPKAKFGNDRVGHDILGTTNCRRVSLQEALNSGFVDVLVDELY